MRRPGVHVNDNELDDLRVNVSQLVLCAATKSELLLRGFG
jgi:hypothetical protein